MNRSELFFVDFVSVSDPEGEYHQFGVVDLTDDSDLGVRYHEER